MTLTFGPRSSFGALFQRNVFCTILSKKYEGDLDLHRQVTVDLISLVDLCSLCRAKTKQSVLLLEYVLPLFWQKSEEDFDHTCQKV